MKFVNRLTHAQTVEEVEEILDEAFQKWKQGYIPWSKYSEIEFYANWRKDKIEIAPEWDL